MADLTEHTLRTELKAAVEGRPVILQKLRELYHAAPKGSTLHSEVRTHNITAIMADDVTLETVQREAKRLNALLIKGDHTKAYIKELKLLEASLRAEVDVIIRHAAELGETLTPETINTISAEVRGAAKAAHAEAARALLGEFAVFKTGFTEATEHLVKAAQTQADLHVDLAKLVGSEEANKLMASVKEGHAIDLTKLEAPVAEQIAKAIRNQDQINRLTEARATSMIRISGKIESNTKLMGEYSTHIGTELSKAKSAIATIEGDITGRLQAVDSIRAQEAAKATAKAADTARQAENAVANKLQGTYKEVGEKLITAGKAQKSHEADLVKLVGGERAQELLKSVYTHGNALETFSKESPEVRAVLERMISHKPVLDGLLKEQETLHEAIKAGLPAERAEQMIAHNTSKIAAAVEGFGGHIVDKAAEAFNTAKSAAASEAVAAEKAKLIGIHSCELFGHHLQLPKVQKEYETARDALKPKVIEAYNNALTKVPAEGTGAVREKAAWDIVANAKDGVFRSNKKAIEEVAKKLTRVEDMEIGIAKFEALIKEASQGKDVTGLLSQIKGLATHAASEHVSSDHLIHIRNSLDSATSFEGAQEMVGKLASDTQGIIAKAVEALGKGQKVATEIAEEGKGNMKWVIGGAVGAAVVGGLALLSGDKPRQKYTDRLNEQQGPVVRGA